MNAQIIVTFKFTIPDSEIAEINEEDLKEWLKFNLGERADIPYGNQFNHYDLSEFDPHIKELWKKTKRLI